MEVRSQFQIVAAYGQPNILAENQKLQRALLFSNLVTA